jgi:threonine synthase
MTKLNKEGRYEASAEIMAKLRAVFAGGFSSEEETSAAINSLWCGSRYLIDTHTAVAYNVYTRYAAESGDMTPAVIVSTASPYKFCDNVIKAIGGGTEGSGTGLINKLSRLTGTHIPYPLEGLDKREVRFDRTVEKSDMTAAVLQMLDIS